MWKLTRRQGRVYLYFVSPSGNVLVKKDVSDMSVEEFCKLKGVEYTRIKKVKCPECGMFNIEYSDINGYYVYTCEHCTFHAEL